MPRRSCSALTGEHVYEQQFVLDTQQIEPETYIWDELQIYGPAVYALNGDGRHGARSHESPPHCYAPPTRSW